MKSTFIVVKDDLLGWRQEKKKHNALPPKKKFSFSSSLRTGAIRKWTVQPQVGGNLQ